jgi:hypothetical protein
LSVLLQFVGSFGPLLLPRVTVARAIVAAIGESFTSAVGAFAWGSCAIGGQAEELLKLLLTLSTVGYRARSVAC